MLGLLYLTLSIKATYEDMVSKVYKSQHKHVMSCRIFWYMSF